MQYLLKIWLYLANILVISVFDSLIIAKAINIHPRHGHFYYPSPWKHSGCCKGLYDGHYNFFHYKSRFIAHSNSRRILQLPRNEYPMQFGFRNWQQHECFLPPKDHDPFTPVISQMDPMLEILLPNMENVNFHAMALRSQHTIPEYLCCTPSFQPYEDLLCFRCLSSESNGIQTESSLSNRHNRYRLIAEHKILEDISPLNVATTTSKGVPLTMYRSGFREADGFTKNNDANDNGGDNDDTVTSTTMKTTTDIPEENVTFKTMLYAAKHYGL